ncbi:MAG: tetratricopeptide repeat protein [Gemmatimonadota bacterium]
MRRWAHSIAPPLFLLAALGGCSRVEKGAETLSFAAPAGEIPIASASEDARHHFAEGQAAMDAGRIQEANHHFEEAVAADPTFAYGYLNAANTAASLEEFKTNLEAAEANAEMADEGVRILIQMARKGLEDDAEGQLELANRLVQTYPSSPRAELALAGIQSSLNQTADARASLAKAIELDPNFAPAYDALRFSYTFSEPRDLAAAETNARKVIELTPDESNAHENLGDVLRAQGRLEDARTAYARASELDPTDGVPPLKMGHIDSFLGNYGEARTEYDRAIELARDGQKPSFANYKAFTSAYAGDTKATVNELGEVLASIDDMGIPADQAIGAKIFTLTNQALCALDAGMTDVAETALAERARLLMIQADEVGTPEFRSGQEANVAYWNGRLAVAKGDLEAAEASAAENAQLLEPSNNPRKMEAYHHLMGAIRLAQKNYPEAVEHLQQANPADIYARYQLAVAQEGAGHAEEARRLFEYIASYNFNNPGYALVRNDAMRRIQGS